MHKAMTCRKIVKLSRFQRGLSMVETALVIPMVLALVFGVFEFGRMIWLTEGANYAVNKAARYAATRGRFSTSPATNEQITSIVQSIPGLETASVTATGVGGNSGTEANISVSVTYTPIVPIVPGNSVRTFTARSVVVIMGP